MADNPLAFPSGWPDHGLEPAGGMTLRDWFAGQALAGMLSDSDNVRRHYEILKANRNGRTLRTVAANIAYEYADAMLAERERQP